MFRHKLAIKLSGYFMLALLLFSFILGSVFTVLFTNYTTKLNQDDLIKRATTIASSLSSYMSIEETPMAKNKNGLGAFMRFIGDVAMTEVWVIDKDGNLVTVGNNQDKGMQNTTYEYTALPENAQNITNEVMQNKVIVQKGFNDEKHADTLIVGAPIINAQNEVIGVVLLLSPISGINDALSAGFFILAISSLVALVIALLLSIAFSFIFTKPLFKMNEATLRLAKGDYTIKTDIKQKDEIGQLAQTIDILADKLLIASKQEKRLDELRKAFVANISHELKTPVTVIRGSLEALIDQVVTSPQQVLHYQQQMLKETLFLQRLIADLLDLSKLQSNEFKIEMKSIDFIEVINDVIAGATTMAIPKELSFKFERDCDTYMLNGDYDRLKQMLMIVIDNAIKFSNEKGEILIELKDHQLAICNQGEALTSEQLIYIFDRFHKSRSEKNKQGTGLGLSIAKQIATRHQIQLEAANCETRGVCFIFKISHN